MENLSKTKTEG